ncbi:DUF99 family protein [Ignisphaera sp. 4213-co]|uniref:UPF0215 protein QPL79_00590 n=1 Tax=Ignisphaera cupida TaxID=3050454 RepID=A0ABD4Z6A1_9CREN|nr:DUF99 family protein [Ignisphaera sp. 4213-co]MDK6027865.1 DUF99 family protein [Ignisphaera sp. 4213-co]
MFHNYFLGIDDGYFNILYKRVEPKRKTILVGVLTRNRRIVDIIFNNITIDSLDGTQKVLEIVEDALSLHEVNAVFLDGVTYAGFNIVDPTKIYRIYSIPVITVFRYPLDLEKIYAALKKHFPDHEYRYSVIKHVYMSSNRIRVGDTTLRYFSIGLPIHQAEAILNFLCRYYSYPYPLHVADRIASLLGRLYYEEY